MKSFFSRFIMFLMASSLFLSCNDKVLTESVFEELEIKDKDGGVRKGGLYLPLGYDSRQEYPVVYMADGLVFKDNSYRDRKSVV